MIIKFIVGKTYCDTFPRVQPSFSPYLLLAHHFVPSLVDPLFCVPKNHRTNKRPVDGDADPPRELHIHRSTPGAGDDKIKGKLPIFFVALYTKHNIGEREAKVELFIELFSWLSWAGGMKYLWVNQTFMSNKSMNKSYILYLNMSSATFGQTWDSSQMIVTQRCHPLKGTVASIGTTP